MPMINSFTPSQLRNLNRNYFIVYEASPFLIILKSKSTSHFWRIFPDKNHYSLLHSHQGDCNYHFQCNCKSLEVAIKKIRQHDRYQLTYRCKENNDFDYIPCLPDEEYFVF